MGWAFAAAIQGLRWQLGVCERPEQYTQVKGNVDREDVAEVTGIASAVSLVLSIPGTEVLSPYPKEWKGQVPKHIHLTRTFGREVTLERLLLPKGYEPPTAAPCKLTQVELTRIEWESRSLNHNVGDAVALGLWYWGR